MGFVKLFPTVRSAIELDGVTDIAIGVTVARRFLPESWYGVAQELRKLTISELKKKYNVHEIVDYRVLTSYTGWSEVCHVRLHVDGLKEEQCFGLINKFSDYLNETLHPKVISFQFKWR